MRHSYEQAAQTEPRRLGKTHTCYPSHAKNNSYSFHGKSLVTFAIMTKSPGFQGFPEVVQDSASK